jgi:hypothetical protein
MRPRYGLRETERVGKQETSVASSLIGLVGSKPAQERRRNERIPGKFARDVDRKLREFHAGRGKRVVAADGAVRQHEHERHRHLLAGVLASSVSQISIERFGAAGEPAIMVRIEGLDPKQSLRRARHRLYAGSLAIAHRVAQAVVDGLRIQQRIDKRLAVANRQFELLVFLDRSPCSILDTSQHEVRNCPSLEGRRMFDKHLLLGRHACLEALRTRATTR